MKLHKIKCTTHLLSDVHLTKHPTETSMILQSSQLWHLFETPYTFGGRTMKPDMKMCESIITFVLFRSYDKWFGSSHFTVQQEMVTLHLYMKWIFEVIKLEYRSIKWMLVQPVSVWFLLLISTLSSPKCPDCLCSQPNLPSSRHRRFCPWGKVAWVHIPPSTAAMKNAKAELHLHSPLHTA
jgi:hypothetical protein